MDAFTQFKTEVTVFLKNTGMSPSALGRLALNDAGFVFNLREGRAPSLRTVQKVRDCMHNYKPRAAD